MTTPTTQITITMALTRQQAMKVLDALLDAAFGMDITRRERLKDRPPAPQELLAQLRDDAQKLRSAAAQIRAEFRRAGVRL